MEKILDYIGQQRSVGQSDEQIKTSLSSAGHTSDMINTYFTAIPNSFARDTNVKLHKVGNIAGAAFLSGPFAPIYMLFQNFKVLHREKEANIFLVYSLLGTVVLFTVMSFLQQSLISAGMIVFVSSWVLAEQLQGEAIKSHKALGGSFVSIWKTLLICLGSIVTVIVCVLVLFALGINL